VTGCGVCGAPDYADFGKQTKEDTHINEVIHVAATDARVKKRAARLPQNPIDLWKKLDELTKEGVLKVLDKLPDVP